ncbi:MAG: excinuclease ABC subunit UvrC [Kiritimatiellae bacterium]|nr:excinuclease ABC subunit UvrC [Kiritimatiellia bacterium]
MDPSAAPDRIREKLRDLPQKPGCYVFRDMNGEIVYVGKAIDLRKRVRSYFDPARMRRESPKRRGMVKCFADLEWIVVRNEAEALLTEGKLIKDWRPRFNTALRDDKRYLALRAETHLPLPRLSECRIVRDDGDEYFGPFPSSTVVHVVKDFLERRWGLRKCDAAEPDAETHRHCHDDRIARCSAPCIGAVAPEEYRRRFAEACAFLRRGDAAVAQDLAREMKEAAAAEDFERAATIRDTMDALREMVKLRAREIAMPSIGAERARAGNAELGRILRLPGPPRVIEGFDISHIQGLLTVASMVACVDGVTTPRRYRRFRVKTVEGIDDPAGIAEVVGRRYGRLKEEGGAMPDLVMLDGGITQLRAARAKLAELGLPDLPTVGLAERYETLVVDWPDGTDEIALPRDSEALRVLIRLRDEAHRFAISYNRSLRLKRIRESALDEVEGVGASRKTALLRAFGSVRRLAEATPEKIAETVPGIGPELAARIVETARRNVGNLPPANRV